MDVCQGSIGGEVVQSEDTVAEANDEERRGRMEGTGGNFGVRLVEVVARCDAPPGVRNGVGIVWLCSGRFGVG